MDLSKMSPERRAVLERIEEYERAGRFNEDLENDPDAPELLPNQVDYLCKKLSSKIKRVTANIIGDNYFLGLIKKDILVIDGVEGEEYLDTLMCAFSDDKNVGFCIDTGHEMCYNGCRDMIGKYGYRLFSTHLNDNMGQIGAAITWLDDAHMLPFDGGMADWKGIVDRLEKVGYMGDLTFELTTKSKPKRHCNDRYATMLPKQYIKEAYQKACLVRDLFQK